MARCQTEANAFLVENPVSLWDGRVVVAILDDSGTTSWMVRGTKMNGERVYPTFKTEAEAITEKQRLENEAANIQVPKGEITFVLKEYQLRDAGRAMVLLNHGTLTEAARYYEDNHVPIKTDKTMTDAYPLFLTDKQHLRETSLREYNSDLKLLVDSHPSILMNDVTGDLLQSFVKGPAPIPGHPQISRPWSPSRQRYRLNQRTMKANELLKNIGNTFLGKKVNTPAAGDLATEMQLAPEEKVPEIAFRVYDALGVIQLHESWRN